MMAIGQKADLDFLEGAYEVETERGRIKALEGNKTSVEGIFCRRRCNNRTCNRYQGNCGRKGHCDRYPQILPDRRLEVEKAAAARLKEKLASFTNECRHNHEAAKGIPSFL